MTVDPLADPALSNGILVYEIVYGNVSNASSEGTVLSIPVPAGTQFHSATGGGLLSGGTVSWNLGTLAPNSGGRERLTVDVSPVADGTLLTVDAAAIAGTINFQAYEARAMAVSRVGNQNLKLAIEVNPGPLEAYEVVDAQISVSNLTGNVTADLTLRLLWPAELDQYPVITDSGTYPGTSCDTGESLTWNLTLRLLWPAELECGRRRPGPGQRRPQQPRRVPARLRPERPGLHLRRRL